MKLSNDTFVINVEAVVFRDGKLLTIVRAEAEDFGAGWLCFPGGAVDWTGDEQDILEHTATREVFEEVGLDIPGPWHFVENHSFGLGIPALDVVLLAQSEAGEPFAKSPDEVAELAWMTPAAILNDARAQPFTHNTVRRCEELIRQLGWECA
jgi:ADP-ribose pyrophosphatase YjhB (NUDIX family)